MRLTETDLLAAAGETVFARGEDYVRYVRALRLHGTHATATIQARRVYQVELDWSGRDLAADCTCPHFAEGWFCKHIVALGLAALDDGVSAMPAPELGEVDAWLEGLDADALRDLVRELADLAPAAQRLLEVRARAGGADIEAAAKALASSVSDALRVRGFVDYRRSFEVARDAQAVLDELERQLDIGAADAVRPALLRALNRLLTISQQADDSAGMLGDACQRAADLHARSCREGTPNAAKLARWLVKFRDQSPGWPQTPLSYYASAFDEKAMQIYRSGVAKLREKYADDEWKRLDVDRMRLEIADHDGDVDLAIEILDSGEHPRFGAVIDRLREADREDEIIDWIDRAVDAGRVSGHLGSQGHDYWLDPSEVADAYLAEDRPDDGLAVLRSEFGRRAGASTFGTLLAYADRIGRTEAERDWAIDEATRQAGYEYGSGAALVDIALADKDLDAAWRWAEEFGAGGMWEQLAKASEADRPRQAADLHRAAVDQMLVPTDSRVYGNAAKTLVKVRRLYERAGDADDFAAYIGELREKYRRRPSLMAALDRAGL